MRRDVCGFRIWGLNNRGFWKGTRLMCFAFYRCSTLDTWYWKSMTFKSSYFACLHYFVL
jgi:hypothetical protein